LQIEECGSRQRSINDSKGCGGVMRIAPVGLVQEHPFDLAADIAAITHGHPTGYLAAATFAEVIASLYRGQSLASAVDEARKQLEEVESSAETVSAVDSAIAAAEKLPATPEAVESLGAGWVAEEALAIALFCSLKANDFASGVLLAVNHGGDSDSTGSLTGNLLGTLMGVESIPTEWVDNLEGHEIIEEVARDLWLHFVEPPTWLDPNARVTEESRRLGEAEFQRYPPW
jgi:ADP-ribosylglycohydrolase